MLTSAPGGTAVRRTAVGSPKGLTVGGGGAIVGSLLDGLDKCLERAVADRDVVTHLAAGAGMGFKLGTGATTGAGFGLAAGGP